MPKQQSRDDQSNDLSKTSVSVPTTGMAPEMEQAEEVLHAEVFAAPDSPKIQLTPGSKAYDTEQAPILAAYVINPPIRSEFLLGKSRYPDMRATSRDYQLKHNDAYYEQYPKLALWKESENPSAMTTSALRIKARELDARLVEYSTKFENYGTKLIASVLNLCMLNSLNGPGKFKDFGEAMKLGRLNNALNRFNSFLLPYGKLNSMLEYAKFAVGRTTYDTTIVALPWWKMSMKGTFGLPSAKMSDLWVTDKPGETDIIPIDADSRDYENFKNLTYIMERVRSEFIRDDIITHGDPSSNKAHHLNRIANLLDETGSGLRRTAPSDPVAENTASMVATIGTGNDSQVWSRQQSDATSVFEGSYFVKEGDGQTVKTDNMINRAWDDFFYYLECFEEYFPELSHPKSEMWNLFIERKWAEPKPARFEDIWFKVNKRETVDIESVREQMIYRRDNSVTTATQIEWTPILDSYQNTWRTSDFDRNFDRYHLYEEDSMEQVRRSSQYPDLVPIIFHQLDNGSDENVDAHCPYVANSISSPGQQVGASNSVKSIAGRFASMLDIVSSSSFNYEDDSINLIALDPEIGKKYIKKANGIVPRETMDYVRAFEKPIIDNTDPTECGFYIIMSHNSRTTTEFDRWWQNLTQFDNGVNPVLANNGEVEILKEQVIPFNYTSVREASDDSNYVKPMATWDSDWMSKRKHEWMFVGDAIWYEPEVISAMHGAGFYNEMNNLVTATNPNIEQLKTSLATLVNTICQASNSKKFTHTASEGVPLENILAGVIGSCSTGLATVSGEKSIKEELQSLFSTALQNGVFRTSEFWFNPQYGPVNLVKYDAPELGFTSKMMVGVGAQFKWAGTVADPQIRAGYSLVGRVGTYKRDGTEGLADSALAGFDAGQFLVWPIDNFKFKKVYHYNRRIMSPDGFVSISGFSGSAKIGYAIISRSKVMYSGIDDSHFIDDIPANSCQVVRPKFAAGPSIDLGGLINPPKLTTKPAQQHKWQIFKNRISGILKTKSSQQGENKGGNDSYGDSEFSGESNESRDFRNGGKPGKKSQNKKKAGKVQDEQRNNQGSKEGESVGGGGYKGSDDRQPAAIAETAAKNVVAGQSDA